MDLITKIAIANNKKNKVRSVLVFFAVVLASCLLSIIFTYGYGIIKNNRENAGSYYGSYYGVFKGVSYKLEESLKKESDFEKIGYIAYAGEVDAEGDLDLCFCDEKASEMLNLDTLLIKGKNPKNKNDIAADEEFFNELGYDNVEVGDLIKISFRNSKDQKYQQYEFCVSGIYEIDSEYSKSKTGYISSSFYSDLVSDEHSIVTVYFQLSQETDITIDNAEDVIYEIGEKYNIDKNDIAINTYYLTGVLDPSYATIFFTVAIALFVVMFAALIIYNIFQIGITSKINEYGKIKAIGATKKQLQKLIIVEGLSISIIAIPVGIIIGCVASYFTFNWLLENSESLANIKTETINIFPIWLIIVIAIVTLFTVLISLNKPVKLIKNLSPVEASKIQNEKLGNKERKGFAQMSLIALIQSNLISNKKQMIFTTLTLGLSCLIFVVLASFIGNIDNEYDARQSIEYGDFLIHLKYSIGDNAYPENNLDSILKDNPLDKGLIEKLYEIDGVKNVKTRDVLVLNSESTGMMSVSVLNEEDFNCYLNRGTSIGDMNYESVSSENGLIFGWSHFMEDYGFSVGDLLDVEMISGDGNCKFEGKVCGSFGNNNELWAITEESYEKIAKNRENIGYIWIECQKDKRVQVENEINELLNGKKYIEIERYEDAYEESLFNSRMFRMMAYSLLCIVGIIGFLNMANTLIISVISRKREIGILQIIGMTNKQVNIMFQLEGLTYTVGTVIISLLGGIPLGYALFAYGKGKGWIGLNQYKFPIIEILWMIVILVILQGILSLVLSSNIKKKSLIEKIRNYS